MTDEPGNFTDPLIGILAEVRSEYGRKIARTALELQAVRLNPGSPFRWASGYRMPIYNDNRQFLRRADSRSLIAEAFQVLAEGLGVKPDRIAGTATAGIPHATTLADRMALPTLYVRASRKDHGLKNSAEGIESGQGLEGETILLIEDLISTGGSSIAAVEVLREIGARVPWCFAIFSYGFTAAEEAFKALQPPCRPVALLDYPLLLEEAVAAGYIDDRERATLDTWCISPFTWGEERGFFREP